MNLAVMDNAVICLKGYLRHLLQTPVAALLDQGLPLELL